MPVTTEQCHAQRFCRNYKKHTLHFQEVHRPNHVIYFVLTLITAGIGMLVWLAACFSTKTLPWRCSQCGQTFGTQTPEEAAATRERDRRHFQEKAQQKAQRRQEAATRKRLVREERRAAANRLKEGTLSSARSFFLRADAALRRVAGNDEFMLWFFRISIVGVPLAILFATIVVVWQ